MNTNEQAPECCPFCGAALGCIASGKPAIGEDRDWARFECGTYWCREHENQREDQTPICILAEIERLTRERDGLKDAHTNALNQIGDLCMESANILARVKRLEEAGEFLDDVTDAADDDIREHLQVANYNLHGLLNTGERIQPPNPPQTIHQAGIDASVAVREDIRKARKCWKEAKEAKS